MRTALAAILPAIACRVRGGARLLAFICLTSTGVRAEIALDRPVDAFRITTLAGAQITPASQRGRILVINLWATWCTPCREEMPAIEAFYRKHRRNGVDVVAISVDDRSDLAAVGKVMASYTFPAALAADSEMKTFGRIRHVPATFVIDRDGVLKRNGWADPGLVDLATLETAIATLLPQAAN